jgi:hypothetical protein
MPSPSLKQEADTSTAQSFEAEQDSLAVLLSDLFKSRALFSNGYEFRLPGYDGTTAELRLQLVVGSRTLWKFLELYAKHSPPTDSALGTVPGPKRCGILPAP